MPTLRRLLFPALALLLLFAGPASGQAGDREPTPPSLRRVPGSPPWPADFEAGLSAAWAFSEHYGLVETDSLLERVNRIGCLIASQTDHPEILWSFRILDVPDPNAFALPGGFVFITRGLLELDLEDADLAYLFGHECAHVTERHFARGDQVSGLLSLLQTAALVAALVVMPASTSGGYDQDADTGRWRASYGGKDAVVQATSIFGGLFRELLVRGYSRGLEMEADEVGRRYAARSGYGAEGSVRLLEDLHAHIFEDQEYGYWRTHPYYAERLAKARAATGNDAGRPRPEEVIAYRSLLAARLSEVAESIEDLDASLFVLKSALLVDPAEASSFAIGHRLLQKRAERVRKEKGVFRSYGPLVADYDSLFHAHAEGIMTDPDAWRRAHAERDDLERERLDLRPESRAVAARADASVPALETFARNYPEDAMVPEIRFRLAERSRLSDRPDEAALSLNDLLRADLAESRWRGSADSLSLWRDRTTSSIRRLLPLVTELTTSQKIILTSPADSVRAWATSRLKQQAAELDSLEVGSRFLQEYPVSLEGTDVAARVEDLAQKRYYQARLHESLGQYQDALDHYNRLILLAPRTQAAQSARQGITRIQTLAGKS